MRRASDQVGALFDQTAHVITRMRATHFQAARNCKTSFLARWSDCAPP